MRCHVQKLSARIVDGNCDTLIKNVASGRDRFDQASTRKEIVGHALPAAHSPPGIASRDNGSSLRHSHVVCGVARLRIPWRV